MTRWSLRYNLEASDSVSCNESIRVHCMWLSEIDKVWPLLPYIFSAYYTAQLVRTDVRFTADQGHVGQGFGTLLEQLCEGDCCPACLSRGRPSPARRSGWPDTGACPEGAALLVYQVFFRIENLEDCVPALDGLKHHESMMILHVISHWDAEHTNGPKVLAKFSEQSLQDPRYDGTRSLEYILFIFKLFDNAICKRREACLLWTAFLRHTPQQVSNFTGLKKLMATILNPCRAALTNMQSVKRFIAKAKIEEVRVTAGAVTAPNRCVFPPPELLLMLLSCFVIFPLYSPEHSPS